MLAVWQLAAAEGDVVGKTQITVEGEECNIGIWQQNQRAYWRDGTLSADRVAKLEKAGMLKSVQPKQPWDVNYEAWRLASAEGPIAQASTYTMGGETFKVGFWIKKQRAYHAAGTLSAERITKLAAIKHIGNKRDETWSATFNAWRTAHAQGKVTARTSVIIDGEKYNVGNWQNQQRAKRANLSTERINALNAALFSWEGKYGMRDE
ncbi:hypothetical protein JKP88DRAFT_163634 [Tribonema minus]|uniref:Uncharacterized protein n=1 Tax=Tribonema minus TaxID=303371 RepID=A0A835YZA1_9STRA|nr:hypothetical protein JKP88DRAFT_163634 [Tribonema minus]